MNLPSVASREEWLAARRELLAREKEFTRERDRLSAARRELPMVRVDKDYEFDGPDGTLSLSDMFEGRRQLIIYHFMLAPGWGEGCQGCSFLVDNIGHLAHLHARGTTLALVSRAPLAEIEPFKKRMGWTFPWYSSFGSDFNYDYHVTLNESVVPTMWNFRDKAELEERGFGWLADGKEHEQFGLSVFLRDGEDIYHTYSTYSRGGDILIGTLHYLDLTPLGRKGVNDEEVLALHDEYNS